MGVSTSYKLLLLLLVEEGCGRGGTLYQLGQFVFFSSDTDGCERKHTYAAAESRVQPPRATYVKQLD